MDNRLSKETGSIKMITSEVSHLVITSKINETASWCYRFTKMHYTTNCKTQSSVSEDGQNNCPKHVELIGIINKLLLLHLVGCLYYL